MFSVPAGELSVAMLDNATMTHLHGEFLGDPTGTDVITFEGDPAAGVSGEICVCADIAADYAKTHDGDFATELCLYVVHGYLHLAGLDDLDPKKRRLMRKAEKQAMRLLETADAVPPARLTRELKSKV